MGKSSLLSEVFFTWRRPHYLALAPIFCPWQQKLLFIHLKMKISENKHERPLNSKRSNSEEQWHSQERGNPKESVILTGTRADDVVLRKSGSVFLHVFFL